MKLLIVFACILFAQTYVSGWELSETDMDEARRIVQSVVGINPQAVDDSMDVLVKYRTNRLIARGIKSLFKMMMKMDADERKIDPIILEDYLENKGFSTNKAKEYDDELAKELDPAVHTRIMDLVRAFTRGANSKDIETGFKYLYGSSSKQNNED